MPCWNLCSWAQVMQYRNHKWPIRGKCEESLKRESATYVEKSTRNCSPAKKFIHTHSKWRDDLPGYLVCRGRRGPEEPRMNGGQLRGPERGTNAANAPPPCPFLLKKQQIIYTNDVSDTTFRNADPFLRPSIIYWRPSGTRHCQYLAQCKTSAVRRRWICELRRLSYRAMRKWPIPPPNSSRTASLWQWRPYFDKSYPISTKATLFRQKLPYFDKS